jgi:hypothetical protein
MRLSHTTLAAALLLSTPANAEEPRRRLVYVRNPGTEHCPGEDFLRVAVGAKLDKDPFDPEAPATLVVSLTRNEEKNRIDVTIDASYPDGSLAEPILGWGPIGKCESAVENAAVHIAVLYEPFPGAPPPAPPPRAPLPAAPPPAAPEDLERAPVPIAHRLPPSPSPWIPRLAASVGAGFAFNGTPGLVPSVVPGVSLRWPWFSLGAEGRFELAGWQGTRDERARASLLGIELAGCAQAQLGRSRFGLRACVFGGPGQLSYQAKDSTRLGDPTPSFAVLGARLGGEVRITEALRGQIDLDGMSLLPAQALRVRGEAVWRMPSVTGSLHLGLAYLFDLAPRPPADLRPKKSPTALFLDARPP